jgi:hypothetical protein
MRTSTSADLKRGLIRISTADSDGHPSLKQLWDASGSITSEDFTGLHQDHTLDDRYSVIDYNTSKGQGWTCYIHFIENTPPYPNREICSFLFEPDEEPLLDFGEDEIGSFDAHPTFSNSGDYITFTYIAEYKGRRISCLGLTPSQAHASGPESIPAPAPQWLHAEPAHGKF